MFLTEKQRRKFESITAKLAGGDNESDFRGEPPAGFLDRMHTTVGVSLGIIDRLRILFGWRLQLEVRTNTENLPGKCQSRTSIAIYKPEWMTPKRKHYGGEAILPEE